MTRLISLMVFACISAPAALAAQSPSPDSTVTPSYHGLALGLPASVPEASLSLFLVGYQRVQLQAGRVGTDFAIGTAPRVLAAGIGNVGGRAGLSVPLRATDDVLVVPSAGIGFVGILFSGGRGGTVGGYLGVSAILLSGSSRAVRIGVHRHELRERELSGWLVEFAMLSRRAR